MTGERLFGLGCVGVLLVLSGCAPAGPPSEVKDKILTQINGHTEIVEHEGRVSAVSYERVNGEWQYTGDILDRNGKKIGSVKGSWVKRTQGPDMYILKAPKWD